MVICDDVLPGQQQLTAGRPLHGQQQAQQGALAGAGVPGDEQELAAPGMETQLVQADMAVGVALAHLLETDHPLLLLREQRLDEGLGLERAQVVDALADADVADRQRQLLGQGEDHPALGGAVQLGQRQAG